ncbi:type II secretion system F family protein [Agromyces mediolanus]|uniref:type II secretion system F family protein n=1 Tax=Agromyces mediolanus TaxID=41986 RepID=UPI003837990A
MVQVTAFALVVGLLLGLGAWLLLASAPRFGRRPLIERVAPFVSDVSAAARDVLDRRPNDPALVLAAVFEIWGIRLRRISVLSAQSGAAALRLRQAGWHRSVERFRLEQSSVSAIVAMATAAAILFAPAASAGPVLIVGGPIAAAFAAAAACELLLQRSARLRLARIDDELPTVLEFLTLSLTAGESLLDAVRRVARSADGELSAEFARVVASAGAGSPLIGALAEMRDRLAHPPLTRALDQVLGAVERGSPLAAVLRAQATDARESAKRRLIEAAGRKEIAMLVPLVFLILPVTVVFGLYPGYVVLQAGF